MNLKSLALGTGTPRMTDSWFRILLAIYGIGARLCPQARVLGPDLVCGPEMQRKKLRRSSGLHNSLSSSPKGKPGAGAG